MSNIYSGHFLSAEIDDGAIFATMATESLEDIFIEAKITEFLESTIDYYALTYHPGFIDIEAKPTFDLLRSQLSEMVAKIDALQFKDVR